jgi:hypothetical protein
MYGELIFFLLGASEELQEAQSYAVLLRRYRLIQPTYMLFSKPEVDGGKLNATDLNVHL